MKEKRVAMRNELWPETEVSVTYQIKTGSGADNTVTIKGGAKDISARGLFVKSDNIIPIKKRVSLLIDFHPKKSPEISIRGKGVVMRQDKGGFAIRFTEFNATEFGECVVQKLNCEQMG